MPKPPLLGKPYRAPQCEEGDMLFCEHNDGDILVAGITEAPIPWPAYVTPINPRLIPILTGDLTRAVRTESAASVAYWWGVSRYTVRRWRRRLGVPRMNEGTKALWRQLASSKLTDEARRKGAIASNLAQRG